MDFWFPVNPLVQLHYKCVTFVWRKNSVDADQLASSETSWSGSTMFICLFDLILYVPSTIFQLCRDIFSWVAPVLS